MTMISTIVIQKTKSVVYKGNIEDQPIGIITLAKYEHSVMLLIDILVRDYEDYLRGCNT